MGRRKKSNDGGGAILLLALAVFAVIFIIKLTTTIVFYCLLPALGIVWVATWRPTGPRVPFQPTAFDNQESWREIQRLSDQRRAAFKYLNKQYETGFAQNLTLTAKSQETMFHAGSRLGKQLNANLEAGFSDLRNLSAKIRQLRSDVAASFPDWQRPISHWIWLKRLNVTSGSGLVIGVMSAAILWRTAIIPTSISEYAGKALLWDPRPELEKGPLVVAACLTAFLTAGAWVATGETRWKQINENAIREWEDLENKWHYPIEDEIFEMNAETTPSSGDNRDQERPDYQSANTDPWYTVLGISPTSTDEEIKRAYREAIKQYHPDKVSTLGVRLRDVAEQESRRINEAFSTAKAARGFV